MTELLNHQNNDNSYAHGLSNLYNYTYTTTYNFFNTPYWNNVYKGYGYLWTEASEIFWHQIIYDPIQDTFLKKTTENFIEYGYPERTVNFHVNGGFHKLIHDCLGGQLAHSAIGFFLELGIHMAIKIVAIASYPLIEPLHLSEYIPRFIHNNIIEPTVKFLGIHPLEIVNTVRVIPDRIFGEDNYISNTIDSFTLHKNHYHDRIKDPNYEQFMKGYDLWMEGNDALVHAYDDISVFAKNIHLPRMYQKISYWLEFKVKLYRNTMDVDLSKEHKISHLRDLNIIFHYEDHSHENKTCSNGSDSSIKSFASTSFTFIGEQLPYVVLPLMFYAYNNMYFVVDSLFLDNTQEPRLPNLVEHNPQTIANVVKPIIQKGLVQSSKIILRSLSESHIALEHTESGGDIVRSSFSCPDFKNIVDTPLMEQGDALPSSTIREVDSAANIHNIGLPATPTREIHKSGSCEISAINNQGEVFCGSDWSSIARFMITRRKECSTPNCRLAKVQSDISLLEKDPRNQNSPFKSQTSSVQLSKLGFPSLFDTDEAHSNQEGVIGMQRRKSDESDKTTVEDISLQGDFVGSDTLGSEY